MRAALLVLAVALTGCAGAVDVLDAEDAPASAASPTATHAAVPGGVDTTVTRIVDGDTLYVADLPVRIRLIGIDTPETVHPDRGVECFGREAGAHLSDLVPPGTRVMVEFDVERTDRYDRPLGYLWRLPDGLHVNLAMVEDGYAQVLTVPPNVRYTERFLAAQREAREAGRGLWSACRE